MDLSTVSSGSNQPKADFGLKNRDSTSERLSTIRDLNQRVSNDALQPKDVIASSDSASFGLNNRDSASERLSSIRDLNQRVLGNKLNPDDTLNSDSRADLGLRDRNTADERVSSIQQLEQRVVENHGFKAKAQTQEALTHNTKIINIPPLQRGSLLDTRA